METVAYINCLAYICSVNKDNKYHIKKDYHVFG